MLYLTSVARFKDRKEAGIKLALNLQRFKGTNAVVLGLPRGGIVTAAAIARKLNLPLEFLVIKKIGAPGDPELSIGAISEDGQILFDDELSKQVDEDYKKKESEIKFKEARARGVLYRGSEKVERFDGKTVILVDDGIATGTTMRAAVKSAKVRGAEKVVVAVPFTSSEGADKIKREAELVTISIEPTLVSVGEFYDEFPQIEDNEVVKILNYAKNDFNN